MKKLIITITIITVSLIFSIITYTNSNPVLLLNQTVNAINRYDYDKANDKIKKIEECVSSKNSTYEQLASDYAEKYSKLKLFNTFKTISLFNSNQFDDGHRMNHDLVKGMFNTLAELYKDSHVDYSDCEEGCEGYYTEHPDAEPQEDTYSKILAGKFNNPNDGNSVYSQAYNVTEGTTVKYYGDFAIKTITTYTYDEGAYKWVGGNFYDRPASFKSNYEHTLYYKGIAIESEDGGTFINYHIFEVEGSTYLVQYCVPTYEVTVIE